MAIPQKDLKLLWGRSGNRCAICKVELSIDAQHSSTSFPLGEQAHIVSEESDGPRGASLLTQQQRNSYHNLVLLCPNHHTEIDKNVVDWPVEKLHMVKSEHEFWVQGTLAETTDTRRIAEQAIVSSIIDSAVDKCRLREWKNWTSFALAPDPQWPKGFTYQIFDFREQVIAAVWPPGFDELRRATITFSILLNKAAQTFLEHSEEHGDRLYPHKFYKRDGQFNPNYDRDAKEYENWLDRCLATLREATKAANWFADVVRRDVNPMFFAVEGKFLVSEGPFIDLSFRTQLLEYSDEEKSNLPSALYGKEGVD
jgi:hypothetical protein